MARFGLVVRDDPPKVINYQARQWGPAKADWALSVEVLPGENPILSVVLRNLAPMPRTLRAPGWLALYEIQITDDSGSAVPLTGFGRASAESTRNAGLIASTLPPGEGTDTEIPLSTFFALKPGRTYQVRAIATVEDNALTSNTATLRV